MKGKIKINKDKIIIVLCYCGLFLLINSSVCAQVNGKTSGMRINNNADRTKNNQPTKPVLNQVNQSGISNSTMETYEKDAVFAGRNPKDEVLERRDRTSKHFRNADGSFEAILSTGSVNYLENGQWLTIERAILPNNTGKYTEFEFANTKNSFKSFYSNTPGNGIKTIVENQEITEWQNKKIEFYDANLNLIGSINAANSEININHAKASYANIFPHTEAQITQLHDGRKIDYEITSAEFVNLIPENAVYLAISEDISLPSGWTATHYVDKRNENSKESKKQISIFNEKGEEILRYLPPAYFEKNNESDIENPIGDYEIEQVGQILTVKILVEADWLKSEGREFPVIIDPTFTVTTPVERGYCNAVGSGAYNTVRFGYISNSWTLGYCSYDISTFNSAWSPTNVTITMTGSTNGTIASASTVSFQRVTVNPSDYGTWASYYTAQNAEAAYATYAKGSWAGAKDLGAPAVTRFIVDLGTTYKKFTVGFKATGTWNNGSYATYTGYTLNVTYTIPSVPPSCTTLISPANNFTSHFPGDPLTWNAASGATSYDVYFGTSSNPPYVTNVATTSYSPTLADNTTYYWKIAPKNSIGTASGCSVWEFTTTTGPANGDYRSRYMDGQNKMWSIADNWQIYNGSSWVTSSSIPNSSTANVLIRNNSKMIIDGDYEINSLRIEGLLQFYWGDRATNNTAKTLTVNGDIVLVGNADFQTNAANDADRNFVHLLIAKKNVYNNANSGHGMLLNHYPQIGVWSYVQVRFKGSGNAEWSGTGENDLGGLSILKDNPDDVVTIKPTQLLGWGSNNLDGNGFFMYDVIDHIGTLKIGGTFAMTTRFGIQSTNTSADDTRQLPQISSPNSGANFTLYIDNPNFGISGYSAIECYGNLRISKGTMNVGNSMDDYIEFGDGSSLKVDGGDLSCTGAVAYLGTGSFDLTLSDGRIRAGYFGNSNSNVVGWFDVRNNATVTISGGAIELINPSYTTSLEYPMYNLVANNVTITGGKLLIGAATSPAGANTFSIKGKAPEIELYKSSTISSNAIMWGDVTCYGHVTIPPGCSFSVYDQDHSDVPYQLSIKGNLYHRGDLYAEKENSTILFDGTTPQIFESTGSYSDILDTMGISKMILNNATGLTLQGNGTQITNNLNLVSGTLNIGSTLLILDGTITRNTGFLGGNNASLMYVDGYDACGTLVFETGKQMLSQFQLIRDGNVSLGSDLTILDDIDLSKGKFNIQNNTLTVSGTFSRTAPSVGLFTGTESSIMNVNGTGNAGTIYFDPTMNKLNLLSLNRTISGEVSLGSNLKIYDRVSFNNGLLYTQSDTVFLQNSSILQNEHNESCVIGKVQKRETLSTNSGNFGNNGLSVSGGTDNLSETVVTRVTGNDGISIIQGNPSIATYWDIETAGVQPVSGRDLTFNWFERFDNSVNLSNAQLWRSSDYGTTWQPIGSSSDYSLRTATQTATHFSRWTIARSSQPLPVVWLGTEIECDGNNPVLTWQTASETNNDYFAVYKSFDAINFIEIGRIHGAGNSTVMNSYQFTDSIKSNKTTYYQIKQTDYNGQSSISRLMTSNCNLNNSEITLYPNPFNGEEIFLNSNKTLDNISIEICDAAGRIVYKSKLEKIYSSTQIKLNKQLEPGAYLLKLNAKNNFYKQFVIIAK